MAPPQGFSWIERPTLAALARPRSLEDLLWLRQQGIQVLISLVEEPLRRDWTNDSGLLVYNEPFEDMEAPSEDQLDRAVSALGKALAADMPVAVHCGAGLGRTGVVLAAYMVTKGLSAANAIARVRRLRPNSVETPDQEECLERFARRLRQARDK